MKGRKDRLRQSMTRAREKTLWLFSQVPEEFLKRRVHSFYSPIGWHFGHIARTEEYWILVRALGRPCLDEHYTFLFADLPENPKDNRVNLPTREEIVGYLERVREATFQALGVADLKSEDPYLADGYGWEFALQHECQHQETICEMLQLIQRELHPTAPASVRPLSLDEAKLEKPAMVSIPGGAFCMGSDDPHGYDNEKGSHLVRVEPFRMARTQVTAANWLAFMADRAYERQELWSVEGWEWKERERATKPEYWLEAESGFCYVGPHGVRPIHPNEPANCISWFEADAYARWIGLRLPTEQEWEFAARGPESRLFPWGEEPYGEACHGIANWGPVPVGSHLEGASPFGLEDMAGNVWEWTSTAFLPYPGFEAFPYDGYSKDHMKGEHMVCRGGSWATSAPILRCSFRNWYVPTYRQGFLGLRLAE